MRAGIDAISVPAAAARAFNEKMARFYVDRDGTEMMVFLRECHPEGGRAAGPAAGHAEGDEGAAP